MNLFIFPRRHGVWKLFTNKVVWQFEIAYLLYHTNAYKQGDERDKVHDICSSPKLMLNMKSQMAIQFFYSLDLYFQNPQITHA